MDNTVKFCLELSGEGEAHLQERLHRYPYYRNSFLNPEEMYQANGSVLRIWEKMEFSDHAPLLNFIYETLETLSPDHYRYVFLSPYGDGRCDGGYEGPHHLRLVYLPDVEYEPDGTHAPEPHTPVLSETFQSKRMECEWSRYIRYLHDWANTHKSPEFHGMTPACFDEWRICEDADSQEAED